MQSSDPLIFAKIYLLTVNRMFFFKNHAEDETRRLVPQLFSIIIIMIIIIIIIIMIIIIIIIIIMIIIIIIIIYIGSKHMVSISVFIDFGRPPLGHMTKDLCMIFQKL